MRWLEFQILDCGFWIAYRFSAFAPPILFSVPDSPTPNTDYRNLMAKSWSHH